MNDKEDTLSAVIAEWEERSRRWHASPDKGNYEAACVLDECLSELKAGLASASAYKRQDDKQRDEAGGTPQE